MGECFMEIVVRSASYWAFHSKVHQYMHFILKRANGIGRFITEQPNMPVVASLLYFLQRRHRCKVWAWVSLILLHDTFLGLLQECWSPKTRNHQTQIYVSMEAMNRKWSETHSNIDIIVKKGQYTISSNVWMHFKKLSYRICSKISSFKVYTSLEFSPLTLFSSTGT